MYTPRSYREDDTTRIHGVIRRHNFGVLFTQHDGRPFATHLPFLLDSDRGERGTLVAHLARANPHSKALAVADTESLVTFLGPHSYISPAWYEKQDTVPTWNYVAVHAHGRARIVDGDGLEAMVRRLVDFHEAAEGRPWDTGKMESAMERNLKGIVGFEIEIERLDATFKLNQSRSVADQQGVIRKLEKSEDWERCAVADLMKRNLGTEAD